jgi:hypothetical protein
MGARESAAPGFQSTFADARKIPLRRDPDTDIVVNLVCADLFPKCSLNVKECAPESPFCNSDWPFRKTENAIRCYFPANFSGGSDQGEFDAFAHGVDAFGADAYFVAQAPGELFWFCAAATTGGISATAAAGAVGSSSGCRDDGVIAFAKNYAGAGGFLQGVDGQ